jgi:Tfp pilus assembly protein PilP
MIPTIIEQGQAFKKASAISVRPYADGISENMGLERYSMVLFEGTIHEEPLMCLETNGIRRYITGLNEFAPEINLLPEEEKEAVILDIRKTVAQLERTLASNVIKPEDEDFWKKVKLLRPDNDEFWGKIVMRFGNDPIFLDPANDPYDMIKFRALEAGGFSLVARSGEDARKWPVPPKFYLDKFEDTVSLRTEVKKLRNKALAELQKLFDKNSSKLLLVSKVIDPNSTQYKKSTPHDVLYDNMDKFINGETVDKDKKKTATRFLEIADLDMETLKLRSVVKDATFYKLIATKPDGQIYHLKSGSMLGKNPTEIVMYLKNPLNEDVLQDLVKNVEQYWNM